MKTGSTVRTALGVVFFAALTLFAASCGQDPLFFIISNETAPRIPIIRGAPTAMATLTPLPGTTDNVMFAASRQGLFWYTGDYGWQYGGFGIPQPGGGRPIDLAATSGKLYVVVMSEVTGSLSMTVKRLDGTVGTWKWVTITGATGNVQKIFADGAMLYAGTGTNNGEGDIFSVDEAGTSFTKLSITGGAKGAGRLSGAASGYLSTTGGILQVTGSTAAWIGGGIGTDTDLVMGMIKLPDSSIIAVRRNGGLIKVNGTNVSEIPVQDKNGADTSEFMTAGRFPTGALAIWTNTATTLLVIGVQGSIAGTTTFNNGYVEFMLTSSGAIDQTKSRLESGNLMSVEGENAQYMTSLGRLPVNHLFQAPLAVDSKMTFFASTQIDGLWSFRSRDGRWQWNAED
jgi:hypothetical protein